MQAPEDWNPATWSGGRGGSQSLSAPLGGARTARTQRDYGITLRA